MLEQNCLYPECDNKDLYADHLFATLDDKVIAYARLLPPTVSYEEASIGRVIVSNEYRGKKLGYDLMKHAIEELSSKFTESNIKISAQAHLQNFYEQIGFQKVSEEYLEDNIPHIEMLLLKND
jgi:ElaA protein